MYYRQSVTHSNNNTDCYSIAFTERNTFTKPFANSNTHRNCFTNGQSDCEPNRYSSGRWSFQYTDSNPNQHTNTSPPQPAHQREEA